MSEAKKTPEAKLRSELLCPVHASLDERGKLKPFDNCIACIRVERDELQADRDALQAEVNKKDAELIDVTHHRLALVNEVKEMRPGRDALLVALYELVRWTENNHDVCDMPTFILDRAATAIEHVECH